MKNFNKKKSSVLLTLSLVALAASVLFNGCKKDEKSSITNKTNTSLKSNIGATTLAKKDTIGTPKITIFSASATTKKDTIGTPKIKIATATPTAKKDTIGTPKN